MKGFADFFIISIDDLEIEILKNLKEKKPELTDSFDELIAFKESYIGQNVFFLKYIFSKN